MAKFRKKPDEVEAWRYSQDEWSMPQWMRDALKSGAVYYQGGPEPYLTVDINGQKQRARLGDYIVRDFQRVFIVMKNEEFEKGFEPIGGAA